MIILQRCEPYEYTEEKRVWYLHILHQSNIKSLKWLCNIFTQITVGSIVSFKNACNCSSRKQSTQKIWSSYTYFSGVDKIHRKTILYWEVNQHKVRDFRHFEQNLKVVPICIQLMKNFVKSTFLYCTQFRIDAINSENSIMGRGTTKSA